jgi:hypothetical protein
MVGNPKEYSTTPAVIYDAEIVPFTSYLILPSHLIFYLVSGRSARGSPSNIQYSVPPSCHRGFLGFAIVTTLGDQK